MIVLQMSSDHLMKNSSSKWKLYATTGVTLTDPGFGLQGTLPFFTSYRAVGDALQKISGVK